MIPGIDLCVSIQSNKLQASFRISFRKGPWTGFFSGISLGQKDPVYTSLRDEKDLMLHEKNHIECGFSDFLRTLRLWDIMQTLVEE
jgi:hypothetical protein